MARYEVPAVILVDAASEDEAHTKALALGVTLARAEDPDGGFLHVTTAVIDWPREPEEREDESLAAHAESLQCAAGMQ